MKSFKNRNAKFLVAVLSLVMLFAILAPAVFAWDAPEGTQCIAQGSGRDKRYVSKDMKDGNGNYFNTDRDFIVYDTDGDIHIEHHTEDPDNPGAKHKLYLQEGDVLHLAYCIEAGVDLHSNSTYTSVNAENSDYFRNLSRTAQIGIMLALIYGYQDGLNDVPAELSDIANNDDYAYATQVIIWEYQQQLRSSATNLSDKTFNDGTQTVTIPGNTYFKTIKDRPAEQCYNWILEQIDKHYIIPSFSESRPQDIEETYIMKYDAVNGNYSITLIDTDNALVDLTLEDSDISVTRNGNQYTFTCDQELTSPVTIKTQKKLPKMYDKMLVWGNPDSQMMVTGAKDPVEFYVKLATEGQGTCHIKKTSPDDGVVANIKFIIEGDRLTQPLEVKTNANGEIEVDLYPGTYTITEDARDGYVAQNSQTVTIREGETVDVFFENRLTRSDLDIIKKSPDGKVSGIEFTVTGPNGFSETVTSGQNGTITVSDLLPGIYTVTETVPAGYKPQEPKDVEVKYNEQASVTFENEPMYGDLKVIKTSEDNFNEGITFRLYGTSVSGESVDVRARTDANGVAEFKDIPVGSDYKLEEVDTDIKYVIPDTQTVEIKWNEVTETSINNVLKKWSLTITKKDAETGTAQGTATLEGAKYGIYKGTELIDTYVTDAEGKFTTEYYICGDDWSLKEISPSSGYTLNPETVHIGVEAHNYTAEYNSESLTVDEQVQKGNIAIIKHTDTGITRIETPEVGAEFVIYLKDAGSYDNANESERDYLICDEDGYAKTKDLPFGTYVVEQRKSWDGREFVMPFDVVVDEDGKTYTYVINNAAFYSYVKVVKKDSTTGKTIPVAGAGFQIYDPDGNLITMTFAYPSFTVIDTF